MDQIAVVIPVCNGGESFKLTIDSINKSTKENIKFIFIESESTDGTAEFCDKLAESDSERYCVFHTPKEGLITAINTGIKNAGERDVLLTQDDVIYQKLYTRDWLKEMKDLSKLGNIGLVTVLNGGGVSGPSYLDKLRWVGTWCVYIPRRIINEIGLFDENFNPGCGDDIDYSYRIQRVGLVIQAINYWVDHHRANDHFNDTEDLRTKHALYFRKKWGLK